MTTDNAKPATNQAGVEAWHLYAPRFDDLVHASLTHETLRNWLQTWSELMSDIQERFSLASVARTQDTGDTERQATYLSLVQALMPPVSRANQLLTERFLALDVTDSSLAIMVREMADASDLYRDANVEPLAEIQARASDYDSITGGMSATIDGELLNLSALESRQNDPDRAVRAHAWQTVMDLWLAERDTLNALYTDLVAQRDAVAKRADLPDFRAYAFRQKRRFDYTPAECFEFHEAIAAHVVPLATRILQQRQAALGVDKLRPWDLQAPLPGRKTLKPYTTEAELVSRALSVFNRIDERFARNFATMAEESLLDLETRPGKRLGAYCTTLPLRRRPFVFMNGTGVHRSVQTLFHEAGHAFHAFEAMATQPLIWQQRPPMEFNEVASMALELLATPHLEATHGGFYTTAESAQAQIEHLEKIVLFLPYMSVVDSFQHWVYTNVNAAQDPAALDAEWDRLWQRFMVGVDWSDLEAARVTGWHRKQHIFRSPFYYIEYGMAQIGALQVWRNSLDDYAAAIAAYQTALSLGNTVTLPELYAAAGAEFRFDGPQLAGLMSLVEERLAQLADLA